MRPLLFLVLLSSACTSTKPALHKAAAHGDVAEAEKLIAAGADVRTLDPVMGLSPLHKAAYSGNAAMARLLIAHGAPVDLQSPSIGNTPLHDAIFFRNGASLEFMQVMLDAGASVSIRNRAGLTALDSAKLLKQTDALELFEATLAKRLPPAERALMDAVRQNDLETVRKLVASGAKVNRPDEQGFTPLIWSAREGYDAIVALLLEHGADPNQNDVWMRANAGHKAAFWGRAEALKLLIAHGLEVDARGGYNGYTALHDAVTGRHYEAAQVLIGAGASLDIQGDDSKTSRDIIARSGDAELEALAPRR